MLTFSVYEEAHRRALKRPRLEFRGAGGQRRRPERAQSGPDLPSRVHAFAIALFCGGVSQSYSEYSPVAAAVVSWPGIAAPGARIRRKICRLHSALRG